MKHQLIVQQDQVGVRIDAYVTHALPDVIPSRMFVKRLLEEGRITLNQQHVKPRYLVQEKDVIDIDILTQDYPDERIHPENVLLDIVYEDEDMIAVNKPVGMAVHPASGNYGGTLVNALVHHFSTLSDINGDKRPGIVHRLDKETSGIILIAKNNFAHARLAKQFQQHTIEKKYVAIVEGEVQFDEGKIEADIAQHPKYHDMRRVVPLGEGKPAISYYTVMKRTKQKTSIALFPQTGRTHQLRLHMKHMGHPILGDDKYGNKTSFSRLALHAQAIYFKHPRSKILMELSIPLPQEFLLYI